MLKAAKQPLKMPQSKKYPGESQASWSFEARYKALLSSLTQPPGAEVNYRPVSLTDTDGGFGYS